MSLNRLHNVTNPYQGQALKVLCVCSAGLLRSPTAANVLHREFGFNTRAAGLEEDFALIPVDMALLAWADEIVCMDGDQEDELNNMLTDFQLDKEVICLNIDDDYSYMDERLQKQIVANYKAATSWLG